MGIVSNHTERPYTDWGQVHGWFDLGDAVVLTTLLNRLPLGGLVVNVGTFAGRNLAAVAGTIRQRGLKVLAVDPWVSTAQYHQTPDEWQNTYDIFCQMLRDFGLRDNVTAMKMTSFEAATTFKPRTLDLVFVDAEHTYEAVSCDIMSWRPLLKPGGIIAGHDYGHPLYPGVRAAVDELLPNACCLGDVESTVWFADV